MEPNQPTQTPPQGESGNQPPVSQSIPPQKKSVLKLVLVLIFICVLFSFGTYAFLFKHVSRPFTPPTPTITQNTSPIPNLQPTWKKFTSNTYHISFNYPSNWKGGEVAHPTPDEQNTPNFGTPNLSTIFGVSLATDNSLEPLIYSITVYTAPAGNITSTKEYVDQAINTLNKRYQQLYPGSNDISKSFTLRKSQMIGGEIGELVAGFPSAIAGDMRAFVLHNHQIFLYTLLPYFDKQSDIHQKEVNTIFFKMLDSTTFLDQK